MSSASLRPGFAVATAVFALVVVGALAMGTLVAATTELRGGAGAVHEARATMAADWGLEQSIASWTREWNGRLARGYSRQWTMSTPEGAQISATVVRLADELYLITADARAGPARRHVARVVRLEMEDRPLPAALIVTRALSVSGSGTVDGADHRPAHWDCPPPLLPVPSLGVVDTASLLRFGQLDWVTLAAMANSRVSLRVTGAAPRFTAEECDTSDPFNWGEPHKRNGGPCVGYYPVVYAPGDLVVDGGRGEGLLIVDGNLTVQGGFEFFGVVLVRGALYGGPGGTHITGAVSVAAQPDSTPAFDGIAIEFSRCAVRRSLLELARPVPIVERSWTQWFDAQ